MSVGTSSSARRLPPDLLQFVGRTLQAALPNARPATVHRLVSELDALAAVESDPNTFVHTAGKKAAAYLQKGWA
eukprot:2799049-Prymnesium_polylepis.1